MAGARIVLLLVTTTVAALIPGRARASNGIVGEGVNWYYPCSAPSLTYNIANVWGFISHMTPGAGLTWPILAFYEDDEVWDRDFHDSNLIAGGLDSAAGDQSGSAISYFSMHGVCQDIFGSDGSWRACNTGADCLVPPPGQVGPGRCTKGPLYGGTCLWKA